MIYFLAIKNTINNQMSLNDKIMNLLNTMSWVTKRIKLVLSKCCGVAWIGGAHCWMLWSIKIKTTCVEGTGINNEWLASWMFLPGNNWLTSPAWHHDSLTHWSKFQVQPQCLRWPLRSGLGSGRVQQTPHSGLCQVQGSAVSTPQSDSFHGKTLSLEI